ncbi:hypothetical protein PENSPDRAFT_671598 [Peniophora sp. CONT]|nr:hypothetical protein PENSPDRAFT_671598 [Peniophora sp. CONT]
MSAESPMQAITVPKTDVVEAAAGEKRVAEEGDEDDDDEAMPPLERVDGDEDENLRAAEGKVSQLDGQGQDIGGVNAPGLFKVERGEPRQPQTMSSIKLSCAAGRYEVAAFQFARRAPPPFTLYDVSASTPRSSAHSGHTRAEVYEHGDTRVYSTFNIDRRAYTGRTDGETCERAWADLECERVASGDVWQVVRAKL